MTAVEADCRACTYCGDPTDKGRDHVVPVSWNHTSRAGATWRVATVPACRECNSLLGNTPIHNVAGRANFIAARLAAKHARLLSSPRWTEDEIAELGHTLRTKVRRDMRRRDRILARIDEAHRRAAEEWAKEALEGTAIGSEDNFHRRTRIVGDEPLAPPANGSKGHVAFSAILRSSTSLTTSSSKLEG